MHDLLAYFYKNIYGLLLHHKLYHLLLYADYNKY